MSQTGYLHDAGWSSTAVNASSVATAASATTGTISNDGRVGTEVSVECAFGAGTISGDCIAYVLRDVDGTNLEAATDRPYGLAVPVPTASTTRRMVFDVPGWISAFRVHVANASGVTCTLTVRTRQSVAATEV